MELDSSALAPGTVLDGKFRVVRCMGVGGMGAVYEIEHELTKHRRALKLLHASMTAIPGVVERFLREASAAGRVGNPHIVETFDAGHLDSGEPYLVMEMLRGEPLSSRIDRGPMAVADVVDMIGQACDGVQAAHEAGIVHRDLKPDNLFVVDVDGRPFVKLLDFGISKFDHNATGALALTQEGAALGTPYYMSPEQIRGEKDLDARTDIYALGVILYECIVGRRPFEAEALTQLAVLIHMGQPTAVEKARPGLPDGFPQIVSRAMATDPARRFQSARELREALERYGTVSFRGISSPGSSYAVPALSSPPPKGLATSAAGVSVRGVATAPPQRSNLSPIVIGFGILGAAALGGIALLRSGASSGPDPAPSATASPAAAGAPSEARLVSPTPPAPPAPPGPNEAPSPSASASADGVQLAHRPPFPAVTPTLQPPPVPSAAVPPTPTAVTPQGKPTPAPEKPRRTEREGLAKDNPFK